jgi:hypothetical protein
MRPRRGVTIKQMLSVDWLAKAGKCLELIRPIDAHFDPKLLCPMVAERVREKVSRHRY